MAHSVYDSNAFTCDPEIFSLGIPILGICYGMQFMAKTFGGLITKSEICEYGKSEMLIHDDSPLYNHLPFNQIVWMSHGDYVKTLPQGFKKMIYMESILSVSYTHLTLPTNSLV